MAKSHQEITDDEMLGEYTPDMGSASKRFDRILWYRLRMKVLALSENVYNVGQLMQVKFDDLIASYEKVSASQDEVAQSHRTLQRATVGLTIIIALATVAYVRITWLSVKAQNEANDIQRQQLEQLAQQQQKKPAP